MGAQFGRIEDQGRLVDIAEAEWRSLVLPDLAPLPPDLPLELSGERLSQPGVDREVESDFFSPREDVPRHIGPESDAQEFRVSGIDSGEVRGDSEFVDNE